MSKYNWDKIDKNYNWIAKDSDGMIVAYGQRPILREHSWNSSSVGDPTDLLGYSHWWESDSDWKESIEERPKYSKRYELSYSQVILDTAQRKWLDLTEVVDRLNKYEEETK